MFKYLIPSLVVALVGCAGQPQATYRPADMKNFIPNCRDAKMQIDYLQQKINEYNAYHQTNVPTLEDRRYYGKLKNNLWSLRSSCNQKFL